MNVLVICDPYHSSSSYIARAAAASFQKFAVVKLVTKIHEEDFQNLDFLVVGGGWGITSQLEQLFIQNPHLDLEGTLAAVFNTHYRHSASGLPTRVLSHILVKHGATLMIPPETFYIIDFNGPLEKGEMDRADAWAKNLTSRLVPA